jgi:protein-tyrosine-phosphatase
MAEYLLRERLGSDTSWKVASAGTSAISGFTASGYAVEALAELDIEMRGHLSAPLTDELVGSCDVILGMTRMHVDEILGRYPQAKDKVFLLTSFRESAGGTDVVDPIGMSLEVYRGIRDAIDAELPDVIRFLVECGGSSDE